MWQIMEHLKGSSEQQIPDSPTMNGKPSLNGSINGSILNSNTRWVQLSSVPLWHSYIHNLAWGFVSVWNKDFRLGIYQFNHPFIIREQIIRVISIQHINNPARGLLSDYSFTAPAQGHLGMVRLAEVKEVAGVVGGLGTGQCCTGTPCRTSTNTVWRKDTTHWTSSITSMPSRWVNLSPISQLFSLFIFCIISTRD